jgi:hypothetical protein
VIDHGRDHTRFRCNVALVRRSIIVGLLAIAAPAHAGRTFYGWLYGSEVMPERGAELQTWVSEESDLTDEGHADETSWVVQPMIGIDDQLELVLPLQLTWSNDNSVDAMMQPIPPKFTFENYGAEIRYRLVTQDPVDAPPLAPLVRFAVKRSPHDHKALRVEGDFVASYQSGRFHGLVDLGVVSDASWANNAKQHFEVRPGAGVSIEVGGDVRLGAEVYSEIALDDNGGSTWAIVGPNLAYSHGRSWISAMGGVGIYNIHSAGRLQWGIAF